MKDINIRLNETTFAEAEEVLENIGLTTEVAIEIFLKRVVIENGLPFELKRPNGNTLPTNTESVTAMEASNSDLKEKRLRSEITHDMKEALWKQFLVFFSEGGAFVDHGELVAESSGMNKNSAIIHLNILAKLVKGFINKRSLKIQDLAFYMDKIKSEFDDEYYSNALKSIERSLAYWGKNIPSYADSVEEFLSKLKKEQMQTIAFKQPQSIQQPTAIRASAY